MSDIRNFFKSSLPKKSDPSPKKSSLNDERTLTATPPKLKKKNEARKIPKEVFLDNDSDIEEPVPRAVKKEVKKKEEAKRNAKKATLDSSEEEYFKESIGTKIGKKQLKRRSNRIISDDDEEEFFVPTPKKKTPSPVKKPPPKKRKVYIEDSSDEDSPDVVNEKESSPEIMEIDNDSEPEIKKKKGRRKTPPNQKKLDEILTKKVPSNKKLPKVVEMPAEKSKKSVDPLTFFGGAGVRTTQSQKQKTPVKNKVDLTDELASSSTSRRTSPRKPLAQITKTPSPKDKLNKSTGSTPEKPKEQISPKKVNVEDKSKQKISSRISQKKQKEVEKVIKKAKKSTVCVKMDAPPLVIRKKAELPWVEKYKPTDMKALTGQNTDKAPAKKLLQWLKEWPKHNLGVNALVKKPKPANAFLAQQDGSSFKAALVSGPPGIGKTSAAVICCKELGLKYVELNASDARNKKLLADKTTELLGSRQIEEYFDGKKPENNPNEVTHVLIMDEVDGMSGNQDRGGVAEVIQMIKDSKIPIICICNDRMHPKIRSLANHCFDLRFNRPRVEQIKSRLLSIISKEKVKVSAEILNNLIEASNQDIRQCVYSLQLLAAGSKGNIEKKNVSVNIFEAARSILSRSTDLAKKQEMFFSDYSIMPLFVHENYPNVRGDNATARSHVQSLRKAAECLAASDIMDKQIRSNGSWNLLPEYGLMACAIPSMHMDGHLCDQISFPSWLGKHSSTNKRQRLMRQLTTHAHLQITGNCFSMVTDYIPLLREKMNRPLIKSETDGVKESIEIFKHYNLLRDDTEAIDELGVWPGFKDIKQLISTKAKSALTRTLNKDTRLLPYAVINTVKTGRRKAVAVEEELDEEGHVVTKVVGGNSEDEAEEEDVDNTPDIVVKTTTANKGDSTSKRGKATGRGRGRGKNKA